MTVCLVGGSRPQTVCWGWRFNSRVLSSMRLLRKAAGPGIRSRTGHLDDSVSIDFGEYALVYGKGSKIVRHAFSAVASLH